MRPTPTVKLCAIAKNEGAYLADWVHHHLHFGFDGIEVWVNDTEDASLALLRRIGRCYPHVRHRRVDALLRTSLDTGIPFQLEAYARLARRARLDGYSHVAFLDLDEYWVPRDFRSGIQSFLPADPSVNVVSFPWCLDVPEPDRPPFAPLFRRTQQLQIDPHVKSVIRMNGTVRRFTAHSAVTKSGQRLLVDRPFPLLDQRAQRRGALVPRPHLVSAWDDLPRAFVMHAKCRSETEYLASLTQGMQQAGRELEFKANRRGYLPTAAPRLNYTPPPLALWAYRRRREAFLEQVDVTRQTRRSRRHVLNRAQTLRQRALEDPQAARQLATALQGTSLADEQLL